MWPRILLIPPLSLFTFKLIYGSRDTIIEMLYNIHETITGFWTGYVIEPIRGILDTVRTGGDDRVSIVTPEALKADLDVSSNLFIFSYQQLHTNHHLTFSRWNAWHWL